MVYLTPVSSNGVCYKSIFQWCILHQYLPMVYVTRVSSNGVSYTSIFQWCMLQEYLTLLEVCSAAASDENSIPSQHQTLRVQHERHAACIANSQHINSLPTPTLQSTHPTPTLQSTHPTPTLQSTHLTPTLQTVNTPTAWQHSHCKQSTRQQPGNTHTANSNTSTAWQHPHCKQQHINSLATPTLQTATHQQPGNTHTANSNALNLQ